MKRVLLCIALVMLSALACAQTYTYKLAYSFGGSSGMHEPGPIAIAGTKGYGGTTAGLYQAQLTGVTLETECCAAAGGLAIDASGNLYGEDSGTDGMHLKGRVYAVSPKHGWAEKDLYDFTGGDDGRVQDYIGTVVLDSSGDVWGVTYGGGSSPCDNHNGASACGVVFELINNQGIWTENVIHNFSGPPDGANPAAGLTFDPASGTYYGTTQYGGDLVCNCGTVFQLTPNGDGTWNETVIHSFVGTDGSQPRAGVTLDSQGNLYGTTSQGGGSNVGVAYEIAGGGFSLLHTFSGGSDGATPVAPLTFDRVGNLWGTTQQGGATRGTLFVFMQNGGWQYSVFHNFGSGPLKDGENPESGLVLDGAGNLWGTTLNGGGEGFGTIYEVEVTQ